MDPVFSGGFAVPKRKMKIPQFKIEGKRKIIKSNVVCRPYTKMEAVVPKKFLRTQKNRVFFS